MPRGDPPMRKFWSALGPGILLAATSVGASHLVLSPQGGALFGFQLLWLVLVAHFFKYPAFEFGPRYAAATGHNLLQGYARIPGPRGWALWLFLLGTLTQGVGVLAGVVSVAGTVLWTWTGRLSTAQFSVILTLVPTPSSGLTSRSSALRFMLGSPIPAPNPISRISSVAVE